MKIIHYNYGYLFDCVIKGKIVVSGKEWKKIKEYLLDRKRSETLGYPLDVLKRDLLRFLEDKDGYLFNIRVPATQAVIGWFGTTAQQKKFKRANYMFLVKN